MQPKILAVDFDGTLTVLSDFPYIGEFDMEMIHAFIVARAHGHILILNTCRIGTHLKDAVMHLNLLGLNFDNINDNYMQGGTKYPNCRKIFADFMYDDATFNWNREDALAHIRSLVKEGE